MKRLPAMASTAAPLGFLTASVAAGIKERGLDVALVVSDRPAIAAGVFTTNRVKAAPLLWSARLVRAGRPVRGVLLNSGNANACTGRWGVEVVRRSARAAATALGCSPSEVLLCSTGVIGVPMAAERIEQCMPRLVSQLGSSPRHQRDSARAIMTTDTRPKTAAFRVEVEGRRYTVGGAAKGSGMIHPNMATMLAVLTTDAPLRPSQAQKILRAAVDRTFNTLTVDGDTSTNDTVLLLANGAAGGHLRAGSDGEGHVAAAVEATCARLAEAIATDGEGATKLIVAQVTDARSEAEARHVARTIASSLLVKTAVHGGDPNWGRMLAAAGRSGVPVRPEKMTLRIGRHVVARAGVARPEGEKGAAKHMLGRRVELCLSLGRGRASGQALGTDLTNEYVSINAHYRT